MDHNARVAPTRRRLWCRIPKPDANSRRTTPLQAQKPNCACTSGTDDRPGTAPTSYLHLSPAGAVERPPVDVRQSTDPLALAVAACSTTRNTPSARGATGGGQTPPRTGDDAPAPSTRVLIAHSGRRSRSPPTCRGPGRGHRHRPPWRSAGRHVLPHLPPAGPAAGARRHPAGRDGLPGDEPTSAIDAGGRQLPLCVQARRLLLDLGQPRHAVHRSRRLGGMASAIGATPDRVGVDRRRRATFQADFHTALFARTARR